MRSCRNSKSAFTLIEVLLVVVIIMISTMIAIPSFSRSFKGAKLRSSTRIIVMASRYARSVAVLQQVQTAILFDTVKGTLEVVAIKDNSNSGSKFINDSSGAESVESEEAASVDSRLQKSLDEDVRIIDVYSEDSDDGILEVDGIYTAVYYPNGMCDEYSIELEDEKGKRVKISVDPLSGKSEVEHL